MFSGDYFFYAVDVDAPKLVIKGEDQYLRKGQHTWLNTRLLMLLNVVRLYNGLGDFRELESYEIETFYEALRTELKELTRPVKK